MGVSPVPGKVRTSQVLKERRSDISINLQKLIRLLRNLCLYSYPALQFINFIYIQNAA